MTRRSSPENAICLGMMRSELGMTRAAPVARSMTVMPLNVKTAMRVASRAMLPAAAPYIFTGLRIGIGLSWLAIVAAEMLIGGVGIGFFIWDAWNSSLISDIILALAYVGIIGFLLDRIVALTGKLVGRGTVNV